MAGSRTTRPKRRRRAALAAGMTVVAMSSGLLGGTAQAAEASAVVYTFVPIRLVVHDLQDNDRPPWTDGRDEPRMYYGTATWWDFVYKGGYAGTIDPVDFTGATMTIDLYERDNGWMDNERLGHETVNSAVLDQEQAVHFSGDWWHYELVYKVVQR